MFGLGKVDGLDRQAYNRRIKDLLEQQMGIETDDSLNPLFPGILAFGKRLDTAWYGKMSTEHAAVALAVAYLDGCVREAPDEARRIFEPVSECLAAAGRLGKVPQDLNDKMAAHLVYCAQQLGIDR